VETDVDKTVGVDELLIPVAPCAKTPGVIVVDVFAVTTTTKVVVRLLVPRDDENVD
jgi:hypothetical protein